MAQPAFNPSGQLRFDIERGRVSMDGDAARLVLPANALQALLASAGPEASVDFGRTLGTELGRRAAARWTGDAKTTTLAEIIDHLGGEFALAGLGRLRAEQWAEALVFRIEQCPLGQQADSVLAAVIEGALQRALSRDVSAVPVERTDGNTRFLLAGKRGAAKVRAWLKDGLEWGQAVTRLNTSGG